jgi:hypothetical protein
LFLVIVYETGVAVAVTVACALAEARALPVRTLLYNLRSSLQFAIFNISRTNNIVHIIDNTLLTLLKSIAYFLCFFCVPPPVAPSTPPLNG